MFEWVKGVNQKMNIASKLLTFIKNFLVDTTIWKN